MHKKDFDDMSDDEVTPEMREAVAMYLEATNRGETPTVFGQSEEWQRAVALLNLPKQAAKRGTNVEMAWQYFQARHFEVATQEASLGNYIAHQNDKEMLKESGLSKPTLEALKNDPTPIRDLKGYELNDYAALARRYGVKDNAFPRMLKWLKSVGKSFMSPSMSGGMVYARDEESRKQGLSETDLADKLNDKED